jgi:hypothetical protein
MRKIITTARAISRLGLASLFFVWAPNSPAAEAIDHTVNFPSGDATWTVSLEKSKKGPDRQASAPPVREIKTVEIVRIGNIRRDVVHWSIGGTTEYWWMAKPAVVLFQAKPDEPVRTIPPELLTTIRYDQTLFQWVGATTFVNEATVKGRKARSYQREVSIEDGKMLQTAVIDSETGLPIEWSDGKNIAQFSFDAKLPENRLEMPSQFQTALKELEGYYTPPKRISRW